jgi:hypothetical protein
LYSKRLIIIALFYGGFLRQENGGSEYGNLEEERK